MKKSYRVKSVKDQGAKLLVELEMGSVLVPKSAAAKEIGPGDDVLLQLDRSKDKALERGDKRVQAHFLSRREAPKTAEPLPDAPPPPSPVKLPEQRIGPVTRETLVAPPEPPKKGFLARLAGSIGGIRKEDF